MTVRLKTTFAQRLFTSLNNGMSKNVKQVIKNGTCDFTFVLKDEVRPFCKPMHNDVSVFDLSIPDRVAKHMAVIEKAKKDMGRCMIIPKDKFK